MFTYFIDCTALLLDSGLLNWYFALCCISLVILICYKLFFRGD